MHPKQLLKFAAILAIVAATCYVAWAPAFLVLARSDYFLFTTLLGVALIHVRVKPAMLDLALIAGGSVLLAAIAPKMVPFSLTWFAYLSFPGLVSLAVMGCRCVWDAEIKKSRLAVALVVSVVFVVSGWLTPIALHYVEVMRPRVFDLYLDSFDSSLGIQPSFLLGQAFLRWRWFAMLSIWCYIGLSLILALVFAENLVRDVGRALRTAAVFLVCAPAGELLYAVFPALGPRMLFQRDFPLHPLATVDAARLQLEPILLAGPRNAIPSLHMAWVLLAWWCAQGTSRVCRALAALFVAFTVTSTLGTGEHYFVDLVVALPFSLFLYAAICREGEWDRARIIAASGGIAAVLAWFGLLRFANSLFWMTPLVPWALIAVTVAGTLYAKTKLGAPAAVREIASGDEFRVSLRVEQKQATH